MKIGVFDSGIGGITVLAELRRRFPGEPFVYLGDTANLPYGTKSAEHVKRLALAAVNELTSRGIDALVVACSTVSSLALPVIKEALPGLRVLGVVEPGARAAATLV